MASIFTDSFDRGFEYVQRTRRMTKAQMQAIVDKIMLKDITTKQWQIIVALYDCKSYEEVSEHLTSSGRRISSQSVKRESRRALHRVMTLLDEQTR